MNERPILHVVFVKLNVRMPLVIKKKDTALQEC